MWIFMNDAMLSIVADRASKTRLLVRARKAGDIERVFPRTKVKVTPDADYRFRASIPRGRVLDVISSRVNAIDYPNFKGSVKETDRHAAYTRVWSDMHAYQAGAFSGFRGSSGIDRCGWDNIQNYSGAPCIPTKNPFEEE